jgi:hypothetical protein
MHGLLGTRGLAILLPIASGVTWLIWQIHDFGGSCRQHSTFEPRGPTTPAMIVMVVLPAAVVALRAVGERRSSRAVTGYTILTAALSALAILVAFLIYWTAGNCFAT